MLRPILLALSRNLVFAHKIFRVNYIFDVLKQFLGVFFFKRIIPDYQFTMHMKGIKETYVYFGRKHFRMKLKIVLFCFEERR